MNTAQLPSFNSRFIMISNYGACPLVKQRQGSNNRTLEPGISSVSSLSTLVLACYGNISMCSYRSQACLLDLSLHMEGEGKLKIVNMTISFSSALLLC